MSAAFDYSAQRWIDGAAGAKLYREQLAQTLALLTGPRGAEFARFSGITDRRGRIAEIRRELGATKGSA